jgi:hypothetical protein
MTVGDLRATIEATAVPQDPAPITATFGWRRFIGGPSRSIAGEEGARWADS